MYYNDRNYMNIVNSVVNDLNVDIRMSNIRDGFINDRFIMVVIYL